MHGNEITWKILKGEKTKKYDLEKIVEIVNEDGEGRTVFGVGVHKGKFEAGELVWDNGTGCTGEHDLSIFKTPEPNYYCDVCGQDLPAGTTTYGCRVCDWDMCSNCKVSKPAVAQWQRLGK